MAAPFFVADAASVTVLRSLASSVFGKYSLNVPEGIDIEDVHTFGAPDNELAYVGTLTKRRVGGLCRRFVRADVTVTAADKSDPDWVAESDVDEVLQEAAERVASDFFLESDITRAGLGPWIPYEDFAVGDRANIALWGRRVELPVTRIDPVISDHSVVDWKVHVGGQVVSDEDARLAENALVQKALVDDRRELAGLAKQVTKAADKAESAQASADTADGKAEAAGETANAAQEVLDENKDAWSKAVEDSITALERGRLQQDYVNKLTAWQIESLRASVKWHQDLAPFTFVVSNRGIDATQGDLIYVSLPDLTQEPIQATLLMKNVSTWVDARVSMGFWISGTLGTSVFRATEFILKAGKSRDVGTSGGFFIKSSSDFLISVTPIPTKEFVPPPPPDIPDGL